MKKLMSLAVTGLLVLGTSATSFADTALTPAEIYADEAGISVEEAYAQRTDDQRFGDLARANGLWEEFKERFFSVKENKINELVENGDLTQEKADEILEAMENCDGTNPARMLQGMNLGLGRGSVGNGGNGIGAKNGLGLRDGSGGGRGGRWNQ